MEYEKKIETFKIQNEKSKVINFKSKNKSNTKLDAVNSLEAEDLVDKTIIEDEDILLDEIDSNIDNEDADNDRDTDQEDKFQPTQVLNCCFF